MREGVRPGFAGGLNVELLQDLRGQADVGGIEESSSDLGLRALGRMGLDRIKQNVCQHTARSWTSSRLNRSSARKPVRLATTFRCCCARRSNSAELLSRDRRYAATNALTDIPDSAARTRANRYTSSGNVTVRFFTGTQSHRNTENLVVQLWAADLQPSPAAGVVTVPQTLRRGTGRGKPGTCSDLG